MTTSPKIQCDSQPKPERAPVRDDSTVPGTIEAVDAVDRNT